MTKKYFPTTRSHAIYALTAHATSTTEIAANVSTQTITVRISYWVQMTTAERLANQISSIVPNIEIVSTRTDTSAKKYIIEFRCLATDDELITAYNYFFPKNPIDKLD